MVRTGLAAAPPVLPGAMGICLKLKGERGGGVDDPLTVVNVVVAVWEPPPEKPFILGSCAAEYVVDPPNFVGDVDKAYDEAERVWGGVEGISTLLKSAQETLLLLCGVSDFSSYSPSSI